MKRVIDKDFCLSSYLAFRYIFKDNYDFYESMHHVIYKGIPNDKRLLVKTAHDIDLGIQKQFDELYKKYNKVGILLSGGMDSAILATYLKPGSNAYTFKTKLSDSFNNDIVRSEAYCKELGLNHIFVDIDFDDYKKYTPILMKTKCAPVHSIEPQLYKAALIAKKYGDEIIIEGDESDYIFGGMDQLLSKDWQYEDFIKRYIYLNPENILNRPVDITDFFKKYKLEDGKIDFWGIMTHECTYESLSSYHNAFNTANMSYLDPYSIFEMSEKIDLNRIRNGESKYLIRELYSKKYSKFDVPEKLPMPRPVDIIFKDWDGPKRPEFRQDIDISKLTGNQKWQLWCAELFLDLFDKQ